MNYKLKKSKAFTLIELMIVIALMTIITSVTLANYNGMNKNIELQNTAYNLALSIREAQVYGINKLLADTTNLPTGVDGFTDQNFYPYGVHFDLTDDNTRQKVIIFSDKLDMAGSSIAGGDRKFYDDCLGTTPIECERIIQFGLGNHISNIRVKGSVGGWTTFNDKKLNILFKRPNPDAIIVSKNNVNKKYSYVDIEVSSKNGLHKACIEIGTAGDISLKKTCN